MIKLAIGIMHAAWPGAGRTDVCQNLLDRLNTGAVSAIWKVECDLTKRGAWPVARACWEWAVKYTDATHVIVMSDDALPCPRFEDIATRALEAQPNAIVSFYPNHPRSSEAKGWYTTPDGLVGVAMCMPRELVAEFLDWNDRTMLEGVTYPEDGRINLFAMATGRLVHVTSPALVDHQCPDTSLVGNEHHDMRRPVVGYEGVDLDEIDWTAPPVALGRTYRGAHWNLLTHTKPSERAAQDLACKAYVIERAK